MGDSSSKWGTRSPPDPEISGGGGGGREGGEVWLPASPKTTMATATRTAKAIG